MQSAVRSAQLGAWSTFPLSRTAEARVGLRSNQLLNAFVDK
jgi:hypothetical protein